MQELQKYNFQFEKPLTQPYDKDGIYNAYYQGFDTTINKAVLISQYREPKYQRIITKHKRLQKLQNIKHKNISQIYNVILDKQNKKLFVILEWCKGGSLYDYEKSNSTIDCDLAVKLIMDLVSGLNEIHKVQQMHRYINMENVQFDEKGTPKLTFKCLYPKTYYLSPEDKQGNRSKQGDLFSLGVLFYKILLGQTPFKGNSLDQQIRSVQQGAKFPKQQKQMFALSLPIEIKNLIIGMTMFKSQDRHPNQVVIEQCKNYLIKMNKSCLQPLQISKTTLNKILKDQFIPIFTRSSNQQQHIMIVLNIAKHQFNKIHVFRSKSTGALNRYILDVLEPFKDVKNEMQVVPIYESYVIDQQYLTIRTFYDNQGSLKYYLDRSGTIPLDQASIFIQKLLQKLKKYGKTHNHLTNQNILIKSGRFFINYPPFITKQYLNTLKNSKNEVGFIAPEIKDGKNSQNADAWSVAMLKYMLQNQQMPTFDKNGKVQIPNRASKNINDINFYEQSLMKNPQKRKGLFQPIKEPEPSPIIIPDVPTPKPKPKPAPIKHPKLYVPKQDKKLIGEVISQRLYFFQFLEKHWTKPLRVGIKCIVGVLMLIFLFYWSFFLINGQLITQHSLFQPKVIHIRAFTSDSTPQIQYNLVTKTPSETYNTFYNKTLAVLRDEYRCVLNDYSVNSNVTQVIKTSGFTVYQVFGILFSIFNLILFCLSLSKMDFPKVFHISRIQENNFNEVWNWMFINMALASQISIIYLLYGSLFHMLLQPCLSKATLTAVQFLLKKWYFSFNIRYIWIYIGLVFSYAVIIFFIAKPKYVVHRLVKAGLVALYLAGAFARIMGGSGGYVAWQKQSVFGKLGQLLLLIISVLFFVLDMVIGCAIKNEYQQQQLKGNRVNDDSMNQQMNKTQQNFLPQ